MRPGQRRGGEKLDREIAVGDGIDRIRGRAVEAERGGGPVAVDRKSGAGERGGAERGLIEAAATIGEAAAVAPEHLHIRQQVMAEGDWLGRLESTIREAQVDGLINEAEDAGQLAFEIEAALFLANAQYIVVRTSQPIEYARRAIDRRLAGATHQDPVPGDQHLS